MVDGLRWLAVDGLGLVRFEFWLYAWGGGLVNKGERGDIEDGVVGRELDQE